MNGQPFRGTEQPLRAVEREQSQLLQLVERLTPRQRSWLASAAAAEVETARPQPQSVPTRHSAPPATQATVWAEIEQRAKQAAEPGASIAVALDAFLMTPEGGQLYQRYRDAPYAPIGAAEPPARVRSVRECIGDGLDEDAKTLMARERGLDYAAALGRVVAKDPQTYTEYRRLASRGL